MKGFTLLECIIYISLLYVILSTLIVTFYTFTFESQKSNQWAQDFINKKSTELENLSSIDF